MVTTICKKATQAINYFARKKEGKINKMKAVKLIYLADRYHLRKYGRPVVGDSYWAMKLGPVGSDVLNVANISESDLADDCFSYVKKFLSHSEGDQRAQNIISKNDVDLDVFSQTDIDAFETIFKQFGDKDQFELAEITHQYPEWSKFEEDILVRGKKRMKMQYEDFFSNAGTNDAGIFSMSDEHLEITKDIYQENREAQKALS